MSEQRCRCKGCQGPGKCWCRDCLATQPIFDEAEDAPMTDPTPAPDLSTTHAHYHAHVDAEKGGTVHAHFHLHVPRQREWDTIGPWRRNRHANEEHAHEHD